MNILVTGASRGIGNAIVRHFLDRSSHLIFATHRGPSSLNPLRESHPGRLRLLRLNAEDGEDISRLGRKMRDQLDWLDRWIHCIGILHGQGTPAPERRLEELDAAALSHIFSVNTVAFGLILREVKDLLRAAPSPRIAALSAKVGSIGDNRMGGWYGYRASKAALNMLVRCGAIEMGRLHPECRLIAIHPGTTETDLTAGFIENARKKYEVHTPEDSAENILAVLERQALENGAFYNWDGASLPW